MAVGFQNLLDALRAAAEPSRLRLLVVLAQGEFSVTELTRIVGQSQPRVSRHLKLLGDAGLLEKFREQHWIYYRVPADGAGREFVDTMLARGDASDPLLRADRIRVDSVLAERQAAASLPGGDISSSAPVELAAALASELGDRGRGALFYFGPAPGVVLESIATRARRVVGMHGSRPELQRARALLHARGLSHCVLQQGDLKSLPHASGEFDSVVLDRVLAAQVRPVDALREAARLLDVRGELIAAEEYEALVARAAGSHPLATLKAWLAEAGLLCVRLHPVDLDGRHVVLAVAQPGAAVVAAAA
jgi:DNA-binding transcriptional ArsR family regulator